MSALILYFNYNFTQNCFFSLFRFAVFLYTCHLQRNIAPYAISLVREKCHNTNLLPVVNNYKYSKGQDYQYQFTLCGPVLQNYFNDKNTLVQFFEVNGLFGLNHVVLYDFSSHTAVQPYLIHYKNEGLLDLRPWSLPSELAIPPRTSSNIHYFAQLASLNDCLYSHIHKSKFIVFLDTDELLVPRSFKNWSQVMSSIPNKPNHPKICSALFRNAFFRTDWNPPVSLDSEEAKAAKEYGITSLTKMKREEKLWDYSQRSKYIADSNRLEMAGIHFPWKCIKERYNYDVPAKTALLHHYRSFHSDTQPIPNNAVQDETMLRFKNTILQRIDKRQRKIRTL